jgi:hypothetical protein
MGYYIRVLGTNPSNVSLSHLREIARPAVLDAEDDDDTWEQIIIKHASGREIANIEKNPVVEGQLGAAELEEFIEEVGHYKPESASTWLREFLLGVKVIYAFQLLSGTDVDDGWTPLHRVYSAVWKHAAGILQADAEGFSDEDGFTILWQFGEAVTGPWNMGIMKDGRWLHFEMDLGNKRHREAFRSGELPDGVKLV